MTGTAPNGLFGSPVAGVGDVDGDGLSDFVVGSDMSTATPSPGAAGVFSGLSGTSLYSYSGTVPLEEFGRAVAGLGDLDGDAVPDFAVGAAEFFTGGPGRLRVYSGSTGNLLYEVAGEKAGDAFGFAAAGVGDLDLDGISDFVVGAPGVGEGLSLTDLGRATVHSGGNGAPLLAIPGTQPGSMFAWSVAEVGDLDGDGFAEVAVGAPQATVGLASNVGRVTVYSFTGIPPDSGLLGLGCPGSTGAAPQIAAAGDAPTLGSATLAIALVRALPGMPALLIAGTSSTSWGGTPLPLGLGPFGLPACTLFVSADAIVPVSTDAAGRALVPLAIPANPALAGGTAYFQWFALDLGLPGPLPGAMSPALAVKIPS